jgi:transcriptional regulator with XRE-family HTH domain
MDELQLLVEARKAATSSEGRRLREAAGLTQGELAFLIGMNPSAVSRWEAGLRRPRGHGALRWARALRIFAEQLNATSRSAPKGGEPAGAGQRP